MPTGYTYPIVEGKQTPHEFMLSSLRAMGIAIMQRDDHIDERVKRRTVDQFYYDSVKKAKQELADFLSASDNTLKEEYIHEVVENADSLSKRKVEYEVEVDRLRRAKEYVLSFDYPADLQGWKNFMVEQIEMSDPYKPYERNMGTFEEWKEEKSNVLRRSLESSKESLTRQEEISKSQNEWLDKVEVMLGEKFE